MTNPIDPSKPMSEQPPGAIAYGDQWWADAETRLTHLLDLYRIHREGCDGPAWCTDPLLDAHIEDPANDLRAMLYAALARLNASTETPLHATARQAVDLLNNVRASALLGEIGRLTPQAILDLQAAYNLLADATR
jgi:hypothetical protein